MIIISKILSTDNYKQFKLLPGNRELNKLHVLRLTAAITKKNLLAENPIIVNKKMEVIDGQHRLEVAKNNHLPIYYTIRDDSNLNDVQMLNATVRPWQITDYLYSYISLGNRNYIDLYKYMQETELTAPVAVMVLAGKQGDALQTTGLIADFKLGKFEITNREGAEKFKEVLEELKALCENDEWRDRDLIKATYKVAQQVDFGEMVEQFEKSRQFVKRRVSVRDYLRQYEDVYNFDRRGEKNKKRFY